MNKDSFAKRPQNKTKSQMFETIDETDEFEPTSAAVRSTKCVSPSIRYHYLIDDTNNNPQRILSKRQNHFQTIESIPDSHLFGFSKETKVLMLNQKLIFEDIDWEYPLVVKTAMRHVIKYENSETVDVVILRMEHSNELSTENVSFLRSKILNEYFSEREKARIQGLENGGHASRAFAMEKPKTTIFQFVNNFCSGETIGGMDLFEELQITNLHRSTILLIILDEEGRRLTSISENDTTKAFDLFGKKPDCLMRFILPTAIILDSSEDFGTQIPDKKSFERNEIRESQQIQHRILMPSKQTSTIPTWKKPLKIFTTCATPFWNSWWDFFFAFATISIYYLDWIRSTLFYYLFSFWFEGFVCKLFKTHGGNTYRHQPSVITVLNPTTKLILEDPWFKVFWSGRVGYLNDESYVHDFCKDNHRTYSRSKRPLKTWATNSKFSVITMITMFFLVGISFHFFVKSNFVVVFFTEFNLGFPSFKTANNFAWWFYFLRQTVGNALMFWYFKSTLSKFCKLMTVEELQSIRKDFGFSKQDQRIDKDNDTTLKNARNIRSNLKMTCMVLLQPFMLTFGILVIFILKTTFFFEWLFGDNMCWISNFLDDRQKKKDKYVLDRIRALAKTEVAAKNKPQ